ncbi:DUF84 family protein [Bacillus sp. FJAT-47783]|uniref:DUF84 family protein n=1 Tax=Bacillus sp. FJAT-47783 TaxID=2922712 RepID=UPI001FAB44C6|nr:DUF84 family protein [Bacillus sp. FJAT-47783]
MKVAIGTQNRAKVQAVKDAFTFCESIQFIETVVPSEVSEQPFSDEETMQGAINRAKNALIKEQADIGIGLEGGVMETEEGCFLCNWGALVDQDIRPIVASGAKIPLPKEVYVELTKGKELGEIMDVYTNQENVSQNEGAIGIFTNGFVSRKEMFEHILKMLIGQWQYKKRVHEMSKAQGG